jgi:glycosyltransferase involved in cell wall biosynthesis
VQLARRLAHDGHDVLHLHFAGFQTPKGELVRRPDDSPRFETRGLTLPGVFAKYSYLKRLLQERRYARMLAREIVAWRPDIVFSANAPLDPQAGARDAADALGVPFVFWVQDIYSVAIDRFARRKIPVLGGMIGAHFVALEKSIARSAKRIIAITEDFVPILESWGVPRRRIDVVENWAAREDLPPAPRDNAWAREHVLVDRLIFLYAGTLGLKHDPGLLLSLARGFADRDDIRVVVVSEGIGADWLRANGADARNLLMLPFQAFETLPQVIASGDVLVAVLEPDAGIYSVPSKVLTYLCAGRPLLAAIPAENLAARILRREDAGLVVEAGDHRGIVEAAKRLADDPVLRARLGAHARDYAERSFDIARIAARITAIAERARRS